MEYTDKTSIENYLLITIDESFDTQVTAWIKAMSLYIDNYCNRPIFKETYETYKYDGDGSSLLHIGDVCDIAYVKVDGVTRSVTTYPANKPYASRIVIEDGYRFTKGNQNVEVNGVQAMNMELPEDIKFACTVLVAGIINNQKKLEKAGTTERIGNYSVTYQTDAQRTDFDTAKTILSSYKRIAI